MQIKQLNLLFFNLLTCKYFTVTHIYRSISKCGGSQLITSTLILELLRTLLDFLCMPLTNHWTEDRQWKALRLTKQTPTVVLIEPQKMPQYNDHSY